MSNQAAMMGEAVVANIDDAGAAWYNPAGLAALDRASLDLSASAFVLRHYRIPDAARTRVDGGTTTQAASFTEIVSVPSALTYVRGLGPNFTGALGVFVPDAEDLAVTAGFDTGTNGSNQYRWNLTATRQTSTYLAGPALAWRPTPSLRVGMSTFISYETYRTARMFQSTFHSSDSMGVTGSIQSLERSWRTRRFGWISLLGVQVDLGAQWQLGATLHTPQWVVGMLDAMRESTHGATVHASATPETQGESLTREKRTSTFQWYQPPRITLGVGKAWGKGWASVEGDMAPGLTNEVLEVHRKPNWNVRAGARQPVSTNLSFGGGVFTDRSPMDVPSSLGDIRLDYYGVSLGAQLRSIYGLKDDPGHVAFSTTMALRYAYGSGHVGGLIFDPASTPEPHRSGATVHELGLHVGSSVEF